MPDTNIQTARSFTGLIRRIFIAFQAFGLRHRERDLGLLIIAGIIGALGGLIAAGFGTLIEHGGEWISSQTLTRNLPIAIAALLLLPTLGGLLTGLIQEKIAKTGVTHGVPEIIASVARSGSRISIRTGIHKFLATCSTLLSGGSAGLEGPSITIGASLGSQIFQRLGLPARHGPTLIGCGAAATMAGIFHTPIAGVLFVLEVILRDFSVKTFMPIVVAAVLGTAVSEAVLGMELSDALFAVPEALLHAPITLAQLPLFGLTGILCGLSGFALLRLLHASELLWSRSPLPAWLRPACGGLTLGLLGAGWLLLHQNPSGHWPGFMGNGYGVIIGLLNPETYTGTGALTGLLIALLLLKLVGTALTIGSGGSGGVIAPSLVLGACCGALSGLIAATILPGANPAIFALVGMVGVIAAVLHCPLTAFLLIFELTHDYHTILPSMLVAITATLLAQKLHPENAYSIQLHPHGYQARAIVRHDPAAPHDRQRCATTAKRPSAAGRARHPPERAGRHTAAKRFHCAGRYRPLPRHGAGSRHPHRLDSTRSPAADDYRRGDAQKLAHCAAE